MTGVLLALLITLSPGVGVDGFSPQWSIRRSRALFPRKCAPLSSTSSTIAPQDDRPNEDEQISTDLLTGSSLRTTSAADLIASWTDRIQTVNINEWLNYSLLLVIAIAILIKLTTVDAGMTRGWTAQEISARMVCDNWNGYLSVLNARPIATKAATSATVYTLGDMVAQKIEGTELGDLDRPRIVRSLLAGAIGHGPLSHYWYNLLETVSEHQLHLTTQWWAFVPKVVIDQFLWGPFWNNTYILLLGVMKMESLKTIWQDVKRTTVPLVVSGLKLWPLAHCITYGLVPVENRLLWVDIVEILWVTILATQAAGNNSTTDNKKAESTEA